MIPDLEAGCSLASSITADQLRTWKTENPDAAVVSYIKTTAAVKAESDYCCTSANAVQIVESIPVDRPVLFLSDMFLGNHVKKMTGRTNMSSWWGQCHVHAAVQPEEIVRARSEHPSAEFMVHPECGCTTPAMYVASQGDASMVNAHIPSTGGMLQHAYESKANEFVVATETDTSHSS